MGIALKIASGSRTQPVQKGWSTGVAEAAKGQRESSGGKQKKKRRAPGKEGKLVRAVSSRGAASLSWIEPKHMSWRAYSAMLSETRFVAIFSSNTFLKIECRSICHSRRGGRMHVQFGSMCSEVVNIQECC